MRQRYYNTEIKRFINQDILTGSIDNSQSLNRYCYVQGNPISYTDPFGLSPLEMLKEIGHSVLDVAGLIPGAIGVVADTVNCVWYALEGNTAMAISCGISALPGLGAFAGAKLAVKGGKLAKVGNCIASTTSFIGNGVTFTRGGSEALNMGTAMWDKYVIQKEKISGETLGELAIFAMGVFTAAVSGKECLSSGNALRKQLKESGLLINLDNRGCVDFSTTIGKSGTDTWTGDKEIYSVAYEVELPSDMYPGVSDARHFQEANRQLHEVFERDPQFAQAMETLYPSIIEGVKPGKRGAYSRTHPTKDVTWHHDANRAGILQLVPINQHKARGKVQSVLHPNGKGGMENWGGGRKRKK